MDKDLILPDSLKNIIMKQIIGTDKCDELTDNGKKCGESFIYSINEYLFSKEKLKDVMINCTKFCLKHLSNLAINGELNLGYEVKSENKGERKIIPITKELVDIVGFKDNVSKIVLRFYFGAPDLRLLTRKELEILKSTENKLNFLQKTRLFLWIDFYFHEDIVDNIGEFKKTMIRDGSSKIESKYFTDSISKNDKEYRVKFNRGLIPKPWRKFIYDCFKYEDLDYVQLRIDGFTTDDRVNKMINGVMSLGNVYINNVTIDSDGSTCGDDEKFYVMGMTTIKTK